MPATAPRPKPLAYPNRTIERAKTSLICSPFKQQLFERMRYDSVPISAIADRAGVEQGYTKRAVSELAVENALMWLIQVGVLRREVDGQGITDSFRLTPLGRQLIEQNQDYSWHPTWRDRMSDTLHRWLRLPFA